MECEDDEDSDLEIVLEGKIVHDSLPDKERRTTVQLERVVDHRINHHCEDHFIAGKDSKTYYTSLNKQREKEKAMKRAQEKDASPGQWVPTALPLHVWQPPMGAVW